MKTDKILFFIVVLFVMTELTAFSQNRNVVWVHGFGGDDSAWQHYETIFSNERQINSTRQSYNTTSGLTPAANAVKNGFNSTAPTNLAIGHSMGGVMIREVDRTTASNDKRFGGFITVASPNYGAPISANVLNGNVNSFIVKATNDLTAGFIAQSFGMPWTIITDWTTQVVIDLLIGCSDFTSTTTNNDLKEGSTAMNTLNNFTSNAHRISIIAEETSPVHWRLIGTMTFGAGSSFSNPGDAMMVSIANILRNQYNSWYIAHQASAISNPLLFYHHQTCAIAYKKGKDWFDDSETVWCNLIKTTRTETITVNDLIWQPCLIRPGFPPPPPDCGEWVEYTYTYNVTKNYKSDGLLPTYAQELKGATGGNRYVIDHANHMELKNMKYSTTANGQANDGTRVTLNTIFNRNPSQDWFYTPQK